MYSMTGYAEAKTQYENYNIVMEIKSLNNKYLELRFHLPYGFESAEYLLRKIVKEKISRGKVDIYLRIDAEKSLEISRVKEMVEYYYEIIKEAEKSIDNHIEFTISDIISLKNYLNTYENNSAVKAIPIEVIENIFKELIHKLMNEKLIEGKATRINIENCIDDMVASLKVIEERYPLVIGNFKNQLRKKIEELIDSQMDEARLMMEVGIYANKIDINEEISRIKEHIRKMKGLIVLNEPVGRTLDFIAQEINREINTIGSKVPDYEISKEVVNVKASLEKIKEQVRNVE